jgi:mannitol/fructose-specific phosphotransferase system IIA component
VKISEKQIMLLMKIANDSLTPRQEIDKVAWNIWEDQVVRLLCSINNQQSEELKDITDIMRKDC